MKRTGLAVERSALCAPTVQAASQGLNMAANRPSPWAQTAIPQATKLTVLRLWYVDEDSSAGAMITARYEACKLRM